MIPAFMHNEKKQAGTTASINNLLFEIYLFMILNEMYDNKVGILNKII